MEHDETTVARSMNGTAFTSCTENPARSNVQRTGAHHCSMSLSQAIVPKVFSTRHLPKPSTCNLNPNQPSPRSEYSPLGHQQSVYSPRDSHWRKALTKQQERKLDQDRFAVSDQSSEICCSVSRYPMVALPMHVAQTPQSTHLRRDNPLL